MLLRNGSLLSRAKILLAFVILLVHSNFAPAGSYGNRIQQTSGSLESLSADDWAGDLTHLAGELPQKHKNLFHKISEKDWNIRIQELKAGLRSRHPDEILVGLMRLVAAVGDSHTALGYRPQKGLPLMLYWFKDGIAILNTTDEYRSVLHGKITGMGGKAIKEVTAALKSVIPHENEAQVKNHLPNLLVDTAVLHGLKIIPSSQSATLTVLTAAGRTETIEMKPVPFTSKPRWLVATSDETAAPLYLKNRRLFYWFQMLPEHRALFFKYNSCRDMPDRPFPEFVKDMFGSADSGGIETIIVDLRHNGGGNSGIFRPFLEELKKRPVYLEAGKIIVLVGRRTFSSAILNALELKKETPALFAGEPTGGKPNHYGEVQSFRLPKSGLAVTYSTKYFRVVEGDPESLIPDIPVEPTLSDYLSKTDPVLGKVLGKEDR